MAKKTGSNKKKQSSDCYEMKEKLKRSVKKHYVRKKALVKLEKRVKLLEKALAEVTAQARGKKKPKSKSKPSKKKTPEQQSKPKTNSALAKSAVSAVVRISKSVRNPNVRKAATKSAAPKRKATATKKKATAVRKAPAGKVAKKAPARKSATAAAARPRKDAKLGLVYSKRPTNADDLKQISGVATVIEKKLHGFGVYKFSQIAGWTPAIVDEFSQRLSFKGRIQREKWIAQCKKLAK